jgi:hypothetical protein
MPLPTAQAPRWVWRCLASSVIAITVLVAVGIRPIGALAGANPHPSRASSTSQSVPDETVVWCQRQRQLGHTKAAASFPCNDARSSRAVPDCVVTRASTGCDNYGCYAASCTGQDPAQTGCATGAKTNQDLYVGAAWDPNAYEETFVDNRWSSSCQANWTRTWTNGGYSVWLDSHIGYGTAPWDSSWDNQNFSGVYTMIWDNMLDGGAGTPCTSSWGGFGAAYTNPYNPNGATSYSECY